MPSLQFGGPTGAGKVQAGPPPNPKLYATYDGAMEEPRSATFGTEKGVVGRIRDAVVPPANEPNRDYVGLPILHSHWLEQHLCVAHRLLLICSV